MQRKGESPNGTLVNAGFIPQDEPADLRPRNPGLSRDRRLGFPHRSHRLS
jgi:hypothetical protein